MIHTMRLQPKPFESMTYGRKTIELRLYDEKRKRISIGDTCIFINTENGDELQTIVTNLYVFDSFSDLYSTLPLEKFGYSKDELATATYRDMYLYYTPLQETDYGVLGIEIQIL